MIGVNRSHLFGLLIAGALSCPAATITLTGVDNTRGMRLNYYKNDNSSSFAGTINITGRTFCHPRTPPQKALDCNLRFGTSCMTTVTDWLQGLCDSTVRQTLTT